MKFSVEQESTFMISNPSTRVTVDLHWEISERYISTHIGLESMESMLETKSLFNPDYAVGIVTRVEKPQRNEKLERFCAEGIFINMLRSKIGKRALQQGFSGRSRCLLHNLGLTKRYLTCQKRSCCSTCVCMAHDIAGMPLMKYAACLNL
jgi:hypothetical protein